MPYRDAFQYLPEAILPFKSVLGREKIELILVDNGSQDGSNDLLTGYVSEGLALILTSTAEEGPGPARNKGMSLARGKYLAFLDADDQVIPEGLLALCTRMAEESADVAIFNHQRLYPSLELKINQRSDLLQEASVVDNESEKLKLLDNFNVAWNKIYRRSFIVESGLQFSEGIYEDIPWSIGCLYAANKVITDPAVLYTYRQHAASTLKATGHAHLVLPDQYQRAIDFCMKHGCSLRWKHGLIDRSIEHVLLVAYKRKRVSRELRAELFKNLTALLSLNDGKSVVLESQRVGRVQKLALILRSVELLEAQRLMKRSISFARRRLAPPQSQ